MLCKAGRRTKVNKDKLYELLFRGEGVHLSSLRLESREPRQKGTRTHLSPATRNLDGFASTWWDVLHSVTPLFFNSVLQLKLTKMALSLCILGALTHTAPWYVIYRSLWKDFEKIFPCFLRLSGMPKSSLPHWGMTEAYDEETGRRSWKSARGSGMEGLGRILALPNHKSWGKWVRTTAKQKSVNGFSNPLILVWEFLGAGDTNKKQNTCDNPCLAL